MNTTLLSPPPAPAPSAGPESRASITLQTPMLDPASARLVLRCSYRHLAQWIVSGELEWVFDLRRTGASRAFTRILAESIFRLQQRGHPLTPRQIAAQRQHPFQQVFDSLFPHHKPHLTSIELTRGWACSVMHIHHLLEDGLLGLADKDRLPHGAMQISRESVFHFMQTRRIL